MLYEETGGSSRLFDWRGASEPEDSRSVRTESAASLQAFDASADLAVDSSGGSAGPGVESSSIRPHFLRRPVQAVVTPGDLSIAPRLISNVPEAQPVESGEAADAPLAPAAATLIHPLSQATAVPLYQVYTSGYTDHFYTTSPSQRDTAISYGYVDQGIACYVEPTQLAGTLPFWRFFAASVSNHFYTTSASEYSFVVSHGFSYEGVEGYLYSGQAAGTVPLHRLSWWNWTTGDLDHYYTTSDTAKNALLGQGWTYDGVGGYVWPPVPPTARDDGAFVSQSVPGLMAAGQASNVTITMKNTGSTTWTQAAGYQLSSQNPQDNKTWGISRVALPGDVAPNATVTFSFAVTPAVSGQATFQWRMVRVNSAFGAATQNVAVTVATNPRFPPGATPYADNYIRNFYALPGYVPPQTSLRYVPYTGPECHAPYPTRSACNPGVPAWTRDLTPSPDPLHPCTAPILTTQVFSAQHQRKDVGTWQAIGKNGYVQTMPNCLPTMFGYVCPTWSIEYWLVMTDPIVSVGLGRSLCTLDRKTFTWYAQGNATREILPGEVTPDSYAMVLDQPDLRTPFRAYVPSGHKVAPIASTSRGDLFWISLPPANVSIPVLGATLFGGGEGPRCFPDAVYCSSISGRAMAQQFADGTWAIAITGYMTGGENIFFNSRDALMDLASLLGIWDSNPTVDAIQNWMLNNNVKNPILFGHSLGAMDAAVLYQRGFGSQLVLFSPPWVLPATALVERPSNFSPGPRPVYVYSGVNDTISNMVPTFSDCGFYENACRRNWGVNLIEIFTGGGFLSLANPHDRCQYEQFHFGAGQCPF